MWTTRLAQRSLPLLQSGRGARFPAFTTRTSPILEGRTPNPLLKDTEVSASIKDWEKMKGGMNYFPDFIHAWNPDVFKKFGVGLSVGSLALFGYCGPLSVVPYAALGLTLGYWKVGLEDLSQHTHTIRRNYPVIGHMRYIFEQLRPEIYQYFVESDQGGKPFNRDQRSQAYMRAKNIDATLPFGTRMDVYEEGYEWVTHSLWPTHQDEANSRTIIGGKNCLQPYSSAILNVSAMSYGALSDHAILALNGGAKLGGFYHNTGEGGVSRFHKEPGGDIVWNVGTGYFGCRNTDGTFSPDMFQTTLANAPQIKMIEIKLSQGAKPGHGGILPAAKVTPIIAEARGVNVGEDCNSPPNHSAFKGPRELMAFVMKLRELSGGKPIGFKMCIGNPVEFAAITKAILEVGAENGPDFITIDGGEGGTGAAPPEFSNRVGMPLIEGLSIARNFLLGANLRKDIKIIASGRVVNGFDLVRTLALGADVTNSARAMMFALGCIQALKCNTNQCPTGIATQDPKLFEGLNVDDKRVRVRNYQHKTVHTALEIVGALGLDSPKDLRPEHVWRRVDGFKSKSYEGIYHTLEVGSLLDGKGYTRSGIEFDDAQKQVEFERQERQYHKWWDQADEVLERRSGQA